MKDVAAQSAARSRLMSRVRRRDTAAEQIVGRALRGLGQAYRKNVRGLPGAPDFANRRRKWAIFVNGCFWHRHTGCRRGATPKSNVDFWEPKLARNRRRDAQAIKALRRAGFVVGLVWECRLADAEATLSKMLARAERQARSAGIGDAP